MRPAMHPRAPGVRPHYMTSSTPHRRTTRAALGWLAGLLVLAGCSSSKGSRSPSATADQSSAPGIAASSTASGPSSAPVSPASADASPATSSQPVQPVPTTASGSPAATSASLAGFQPASVTFVSPSAGFVLGTQACATGSCTTLGATADAGRTWVKAGVLPPALTGDAQGVRKVRFATASDGWAFGPQLWSTHDGGRSWRQVPEPGPVSDVEASGGVAYAIVAIAAGSFMRNPPEDWAPEGWTPSATQLSQRTDRDYTLAQSLKTGQWWAICALMSINTMAGLSIVSQASPIFQEMGKASAAAAAPPPTAA